MSLTLRFPFTNTATVKGQPSEASQIIVISTATAPGGFTQGGDPGAAQALSPWKIDASQTEVPYCDIVLEFTSDTAQTLGNGTTELLGLYGEIGPNKIGSGRYLLGILGVTLLGIKPQIPIFSTTNGFAQIVEKVGVYDGLIVGGILGAVAVAGVVTVRARPIRMRSFVG